MGLGYKGIVESSIMQKGKPASAASKMLEGFNAPFSATVVTRLEAVGVLLTGRVEASEFGVSGLFSGVNDTYSELTEAVNEVDFVLSNDYTGAISRAAAACGLYYIHPTYGTVSRYGLIPCVTSMDQIGVLCKSPEVGFEILKIIQGYDSKDGAMFEECAFGTMGQGNGSSVLTKGQENRPFVPLVPVMQTLCCAELGNNISRYDGIKIGHRAVEYHGLSELYTKSRSEAFGEDVKLAAILGAMVLSQDNYNRYYDKAMRLRRLIKDSLNFEGYDVIEAQSAILSRLCGLPSLATPDGVYIANVGCECDLTAVGVGQDAKIVKVEELGL